MGLLINIDPLGPIEINQLNTRLPLEIHAEPIKIDWIKGTMSYKDILGYNFTVNDNGSTLVYII